MSNNSCNLPTDGWIGWFWYPGILSISNDSPDVCIMNVSMALFTSLTFYIIMSPIVIGLCMEGIGLCCEIYNEYKTIVPLLKVNEIIAKE